MREVAGAERIPEGVAITMFTQGAGLATAPSLAGALADYTGSYVRARWRGRTSLANPQRQLPSIFFCVLYFYSMLAIRILIET